MSTVYAKAFSLIANSHAVLFDTVLRGFYEQFGSNRYWTECTSDWGLWLIVIRLVRKFLRFFSHSTFIFCLPTRTLVLIDVCTISIDDLPPTIRQGKNAPLVEVEGLLIKESLKSDFQVPLFVEALLTQRMRKRPKQMVIGRGQVRRIWWMRNGNPP